MRCGYCGNLDVMLDVVVYDDSGEETRTYYCKNCGRRWLER